MYLVSRVDLMTVKVTKTPIPLIVRLGLWSKRRDVWAFALGSLLLALGVWWLSEPFGQLFGQMGRLRAWILTFGPLAPLVYTSIFSLQILLAPLPGQFMGVMGGYLFGALLGSVYSIAGLMIGGGLAMWLSRRFGRPWLERFFAPAVLQHWEKKLRIRSGLTWWLLFLFPVPDVVIYAAGLSSTPLRTLLWALLAGRGLGLLFANTVGAWSAHLAPEWVLIKWALIGLLAALVYLNQRRIRLVMLLAARRIRRRLRRQVAGALHTHA
jgi:uncharacterized membrane protein YdjX (TVP38/TMEM64 family)